MCLWLSPRVFIFYFYFFVCTIDNSNYKSYTEGISFFHTRSFAKKQFISIPEVTCSRGIAFHAFLKQVDRNAKELITQSGFREQQSVTVTCRGHADVINMT